ncbi:MAG TPA: chemotaxis protein CheA, partial [Acidimicrobiales bacterium]|nr:chemotaxis protein CheA [Acidimicrobiales bacterium]
MAANEDGADSVDQEVIREFLMESHENLAQLDLDLVALEEAPDDPERLRSIFRTVHTVKGVSGFLGFGALERVAHAGESLLAKVRDGELALDQSRTGALFELVDVFKAILADIEATGRERRRDDETLIARLVALSSPGDVAPAPAAAPARKAPAKRAPKNAALPASEPDEAGPLSTPAPVVPAAAAAAPSVASEPAADVRAPVVSEANVRVDVGVLDEMMDLVGELVLARNQILQFVATQSESPLTAPTQRLNLITSELQERVMKTRMQPIMNVWSLFPRTVRDLALACGKQVRLEMDGQETELDRTIIEAVRDPLTHLVRNSVDHGIETPEARVAAGKPAQGRLLLRAFHEGGRVNIEVIDDGGGINLEKVRATAIERRLVTHEQAALLTERQVTDLLFMPGFSTAPEVTKVSGRGVGMDVVKTNIERIGGVIDLSSVPGQGTTVTIKIPLTLAIIPALIVTSAGQRYALPQVNLLELVRLDSDSDARVGRVGGAPVYRLRGRLLPLVDLSEQLGGPPTSAGQTTIVVVQADGQAFGLVVEDVQDTEEIVVKPLGDQLKGIAALAGVTIMGDGRVAVILDVAGLAHTIGLSHRGRAAQDRVGTGIDDEEEEKERDEDQALLLVRVGKEQLAISQSSVDRIEEISADDIETAGSYPAV